MATKLRKADRQALESALYHLQRARKYLARPDIAVGMTGRPATTSLHYIRPSDGATFYSLAKDIGSDLCGFDDAERQITYVLNRED